ncbi:hypothetical protein [Neisseria iguanae]|uniref:Uncharacterized protein n=1 Tax=Neisseria iguanae TaxID=90242 RepID=A0A2P7TXF5_9NEIS|nr:hypothetical protein [Neisseria iguanae]PSJ79396.1 hypothetical protein C7N83_12460 [Neisseria iguanae]
MDTRGPPAYLALGSYFHRMQLPAGRVATTIPQTDGALTVTMAVSLQVFGNLANANDYGDAQNGADSNGRQCLPRMVASGHISRRAMWQGLCISAICLLPARHRPACYRVTDIGTKQRH